MSCSSYSHTLCYTTAATAPLIGNQFGFNKIALCLCMVPQRRSNGLLVKVVAVDLVSGRTLWTNTPVVKSGRFVNTTHSLLFYPFSTQCWCVMSI